MGKAGYAGSQAAPLLEWTTVLGPSDICPWTRLTAPAQTSTKSKWFFPEQLVPRTAGQLCSPALDLEPGHLGTMEPCPQRMKPCGVFKAPLCQTHSASVTCC